MSIYARHTLGEQEPELAALLYALFRAAQRGAAGWHLYGTYTEERDVMTEYAHEGGARIRARSHGERGQNGLFPVHDYCYLTAEEARDAD